MNNKIKGEKLGLKTQLAYGIGQAGDTIPYIMFYTFFLFYLTDVAGIEPVVAGAVSGIAISWNAVADPIVGYLSDNCKSKYGRRRIFMGVTILPYIIIIALLFFPVEGSEIFKNIYYVALGVSLWTCYTTWSIPYLSLVTDMTIDYDQRNDLRMFNVLFACLFMAICLSGTLVIQKKCLEMGYSEKVGWAVSGAVFAVITGIAIFICWNGMRGNENTNYYDDESIEKRENFFKVLKETLKIKVFRQVCLMTFIAVAGVTIVEAVQMYLFKNNLNMDEGDIAGFYLLYSIVGFAGVPIISKLTNAFGKKEVFVVISFFGGAGALVFWQIGITSYIALVIYILLFFLLFSGTFWLVYVTFAYDVAEISTYKYGKRRDGSIIAIVDLVYKAGAALATFLTGLLLSAIGYNESAAQQSESVLNGINMITTLPAAITIILSGLIILKYPVTKKRYNAMVEAMKAREERKEYSEEGFEKLLQ